MRYLMAMLHRRVIMLDPAGGLATEMATTMTSKDVLVAIAFRQEGQALLGLDDGQFATLLISVTLIAFIGIGALAVWLAVLRSETEWLAKRTAALRAMADRGEGA